MQHCDIRIYCNFAIVLPHENMETLSALLALWDGNPPEDPPNKVPVTWIIHDFVGISLNKLLHKQSSCHWFEPPYHNFVTPPWCTLSRHGATSRATAWNDVQYCKTERSPNGWSMETMGSFYLCTLPSSLRVCCGMQSQISRFMGPTWCRPGSCRPQMGPMLAPWTLLSGIVVRCWSCLT